MKIKSKLSYKEYTLKIADKNATRVNSPEIVYNCLKEDFNQLQEDLYLLVLNNRNDIIDKYLVCRGSHNNLAISPSDLFRHILLTQGSYFIIAHNHPSGDVSPSEEDIIFTGKVKEGANLLGLSLLDHIIYSDSGYFSFKAESLL